MKTEKNKLKKDPDVVVFGEEADIKSYDHSNITWGTFLLFSGILLLLNTLQIVPWGVWNNIWQFWPILIILAGIQIILGNNSLSRVLVTVISVIVVGFVFLLALDKTLPAFTAYLPPVLSNLVNNWKGLTQ